MNEKKPQKSFCIKQTKITSVFDCKLSNGSFFYFVFIFMSVDGHLTLPSVSLCLLIWFIFLSFPCFPQWTTLTVGCRTMPDVFIMLQHLCHSGSTQRSFSITANPSNGTMGKKSVHKLFTEIVVYQKTAVQFRNQVNNWF